MGILTVRPANATGTQQPEPISATRTGALTGVVGVFQVGELFDFPGHSGASGRVVGFNPPTLTYTLVQVPIVKKDGEDVVALPSPLEAVAIQGVTSGATATLRETDGGGDTFQNSGGEIVLSFLLNETPGQKFHVITKAQTKVMGVKQDRVYTLEGLAGGVLGPFNKNRFNAEGEILKLEYVADPPTDLQLLVLRVMPGG